MCQPCVQRVTVSGRGWTLRTIRGRCSKLAPSVRPAAKHPFRIASADECHDHWHATRTGGALMMTMSKHQNDMPLLPAALRDLPATASRPMAWQHDPLARVAAALPFDRG